MTHLTLTDYCRWWREALAVTPDEVFLGGLNPRHRYDWNLGVCTLREIVVARLALLTYHTALVLALVAGFAVGSRFAQ